jgi:predicted DNA-binding transcriptional regulator YafY
MTHFDYTNKLKREDAFIRNQDTGIAKEFAKKIGVCRKTIFNDMETLKSLGAEISFNKSLKTFVYLNKFVLKF